MPARFTIEAGKRIGECKGGMEVRLYSNYPFPWRKQNGGPQDEFGELALDKLAAVPDQPVYQFTEVDGRRVLRYATARVMSESCLRCHNHHPDSPWTVIFAVRRKVSAERLPGWWLERAPSRWGFAWP